MSAFRRILLAVSRMTVWVAWIFKKTNWIYIGGVPGGISVIKSKFAKHFQSALGNQLFANDFICAIYCESRWIKRRLSDLSGIGSDWGFVVGFVVEVNGTGFAIYFTNKLKSNFVVQSWTQNSPLKTIMPTIYIREPTPTHLPSFRLKSEKLPRSQAKVKLILLRKWQYFPPLPPATSNTSSWSVLVLLSC